ncbi:hypothetical protein RG47T_1263 [Mucilaginibacter polytrichastri]|uniref:Uncharacterized protein n=1 Tax=Mucilaginibacter polytrichastri TaxID=1302689 RepID=A0A1Q5ZVL3_9SPHI|nr:hypothetical protein RG47T_1263 [Mucilaginibacter polytrichastri]
MFIKVNDVALKLKYFSINQTVLYNRSRRKDAPTNKKH